jgi:hypothetical protein
MHAAETARAFEPDRLSGEVVCGDYDLIIVEERRKNALTIGRGRTRSEAVEPVNFFWWRGNDGAAPK